jgi:2-hydroxychromene-2-carboxylate isomerase
MARVEFFFDCSSPWTYLAFDRIGPICEAADAELIWRPILVGGIFNTVNQAVYEQRENPHPLKSVYAAKDLQDWARYQGLKIGRPPIFPVRAVKPMRGAYVALDHGLLPTYARAVFEAYWGDFEDIAEESVLAAVCDRIGLDSRTFFDGIASDDVKARLRQATEEVMARGGFGSPTIFINDTDMYFGNDRMPLIADALARA